MVIAKTIAITEIVNLYKVNKPEFSMPIDHTMMDHSNHIQNHHHH